jgi:hypothetical protein
MISKDLVFENFVGAPYVHSINSEHGNQKEHVRI